MIARESTVEEECCKLATSQGWLNRKVEWVGSRDAPDRVFIKDGRTIWVEFKAPGKEARDTQRIEHNKMRKFGATVYVVDNVSDFRKALTLENAS